VTRIGTLRTRIHLLFSQVFFWVFSFLCFVTVHAIGTYLREYCSTAGCIRYLAPMGRSTSRGVSVKVHNEQNDTLFSCKQRSTNEMLYIPNSKKGRGLENGRISPELLRVNAHCSAPACLIR
jgi:hypothetical protein